MSKRFLFLPACTVHAHALQEVISCCSFHFAFSRWMFYSFPGMLIKLMKGGMGIELIMFYGSKTQWGLRFFAPVFFSQLAKWLTLPGGCCAPAADGDRYEAGTPMGVLFIGVSELSLWYHTACLTYVLSYASSHNVVLFFFMIQSKHSFTYTVSPPRPWITSKLLCFKFINELMLWANLHHAKILALYLFPAVLK